MISLIGAFIFIVMVTIGIVGMGKKLKTDEFAFFCVFKWTFAGLACHLWCFLIDECLNASGNNKNVLLCVAIAFSVALIISIIIEKILRGNMLRNKKIEEFNQNENKWSK